MFSDIAAPNYNSTTSPSHSSHREPLTINSISQKAVTKMALDNQTMYLRQRIIQERMQTNCNKHNNYLGNGWNVILITITKTCLYNFDPLKPHFYIVKLGFTGVDIIFLTSAQNIDCEYSLEPPH